MLLMIWSSIAMGSTPPSQKVGERSVLIALLPIDNLSGSAAPLREIREELLKSLSDRGVNFLEETALNDFLARNRLRYSGGIDARTAAAFRTEAQVEAVLIVNLELHNENNPPRLAFMARLVETTASPRIIWMESFALAGNEHPGAFELGMIEDPVVLRQKLIDEAAESLVRYLATSNSNERQDSLLRTFAPKISFGRVPDLEEQPLVAVLPFFNESTRKYANDIMLLHFVHQLHAGGVYQPVEPGVIRDKMLEMRIIMNKGVSLNQADLISNNLETDFVLTGRVFDYLDVQGFAAAPSVDFSAQMMERRSKRIVWTSKSYNKGDEGVWFYDWRRIYTANRLAGGMVKSVVRQMETASSSTSDKAANGAE
jgi:hypothetical protein